MTDISPPVPDPAPDSSSDSSAGSVDPLDAGMQAAFAPVPSSVLQALQQTLGPLSQVSLREVATEGQFEAIVKPMPGGAGRSQLTTRYHLIGEIARGGVGIVLRGHDVDLGRDVAIKVLQDKYAQSPPVLQRFLEEAQLGGQLQHPGIVPVYELGVHGGRPFFAMKLVKGRTLSSVLAARTDFSVERTSLLGTFERVCQTIAYAHARGVIHRDLKPANVMVGSFGEVQVVDWGMAKVLQEGGVADERRATAGHVSVIETVRSQPGSSGSQSVEGSVMGTPAYMPPEQALGRVDAMDQRSDVFSLGAILCEVLAGRPPYPDPDSALMLAAACRTEDVLADLAKSGADAELVAIATECLHADPKRRPSHAGVLADRVHGWLVAQDQRAQLAQVAAAEARVRAEDAKRAQKLTLGLAAAVVLAVLGGGGGYLLVHQQRAQVRERDRVATEKSRGELEQHVALAEASGTDAVVWARALATCDQLEASMAGTHVDSEMRTRIEQRVREVRAAEAAARTTADRLASDQQMLERLQEIVIPNTEAVAQSQPGTDGGEPIYRARGYEEALRSYGIDVLTGEEPAVAARLAATSIAPELAVALDDWAMALRTLQKDPPVQQRLLRIAQQADATDPWRTRLRGLLLSGEETVDAVREIAAAARRDVLKPVTWLVLAQVLDVLGAREDVVQLCRAARDAHPMHFRIAMQLARALGRVRPRDDDACIAAYHQALGMRPVSLMALHGLAASLMDAGRHEQALALLRKEVLQAPQYALAYRNLGVALGELGRFEEAEREVREALRLRPGQAEWWPLLAFTIRDPRRQQERLAACDHALTLDGNLGFAHGNRAVVLERMGEFEAALGAFREAVRCRPSNVHSLCNLAKALWNAGERSEARQWAAKAVGHATESTDPGDAVEMTKMWIRLGDKAAAIDAARRSLRLDPASPEVRLQLGQCLVTAGMTEAAREVLTQANMMDAQLLGAVMALADCDIASGAIEAAEARLLAGFAAPTFANAPADRRGPFMIKAAEVLVARHGKAGAVEVTRRLAQQHPRLPEVIAIHGHSLRENGEVAAALVPLQQALALDPSLIDARTELVVSLLATGKTEDALQVADAGLAQDPWSPSMHRVRGTVLARAGRPDDAIAALDMACRMQRGEEPAHAALKKVLRAARGLDGEIAHWQAIVAARPNSSGAWLKLGIVLNDRGDPVAVDATKRAVALAPDSWIVWNNLGWHLICFDRLEEALPALQEAIRLDPTRVRPHLNLARLLATQGNVEAATTSFVRAAEVADRQDSDVPPVDMVGELDRFSLERVGPGGTFELWREFVARNPKHVMGRMRLAAAHERLGRFAEAATEAAAALEMDPGNWIVRNDLGSYLGQSGRSAEAVPILREAVRLAPAEAMPRANLARACAGTGALEEAVREATAAFRLDPTAPFCAGIFSEVMAALPEAEAGQAIRELAAAEPDQWSIQLQCAVLMSKRKNFAAAEPFARRAVQLRGEAKERAELGGILVELGKLEEAERELRAALMGKDCPIQALHALGHALEERGFAVAALAELEQFNKLVAGRPGITPCEHIEQVREKAAAETANLALLDGTSTSTDALALLRAAKLGYDRGRHARMVNLTQQAFALDPTTAEDLAEFWRYNGACSAALAAAALPVTDPTAKVLRDQAREWLVADLASRVQAAAVDDAARQTQSKHLRWSLEDGDLTSLRDVEKLPEAERAGFVALWEKLRAAIRSIDRT